MLILTYVWSRWVYLYLLCLSFQEETSPLRPSLRNSGRTNRCFRSCCNKPRLQLQRLQLSEMSSTDDPEAFMELFKHVVAVCVGQLEWVLCLILAVEVCPGCSTVVAAATCTIGVPDREEGSTAMSQMDPRGTSAMLPGPEAHRGYPLASCNSSRTRGRCCLRNKMLRKFSIRWCSQ